MFRQQVRVSNCLAAQFGLSTKQALSFCGWFSKKPQQADGFETGGYFEPLPKFEEKLPDVLTALSDYWVGQMRRRKERLPILVAIDDSPMSKQFIEPVLKHFMRKGVDVYTYHVGTWGYLPLPLGAVSFYTREFEKTNQTHKKVAGAIMLTAGSRSWQTGGLRFLNPDGSLFTPEQMLTLSNGTKNKKGLNYLEEHGPGQRYLLRGDFDIAYKKYLQGFIDFSQFVHVPVRVFFDSMYTSTKDLMNNYLYPFVKYIHQIHINIKERVDEQRYLNSAAINEKNIQPVRREFKKLSEFPKLALINNPDGTEVGVIDDKGDLKTTSEIAAILIKHLVENKKKHGSVIKTQDMSSLIDDVCTKYGIPVIEIPSDNAYLNLEINKHKKLQESVLLSCNNLGTITTIGSKFNQDGFASNFLILEMLGTERKNVSQLVNEVKSKTINNYIQTNTVIKIQNYSLFIEKLRKSIHKLKLSNENFDKHYSDMYQRTLSSLYGDFPSLKVFFKDGSWLCASRNPNTDNEAQISVESVLPKNTTTERISEVKKCHAKLISDIENLHKN